MEQFALDDYTANRLLMGVLDPDDAPNSYADVAVLLQAAAAPPEGALIRESVTVAAFVEAIHAAPQPDAPRRRRTARHRAKLAGAGVLAALTLTGGMAAANALPGAVQGVASDALATVGVHVPSPDDHAGDHPNVRGKSGDHQDGAVDETTSTTATGTPAGTPPDNKGAQISDLAHNTDPGPGHGATVSDEASNGKSQAGDPHGNPASPATPGGPPASTPGNGNGPPDHPGGKPSEGNQTANEHSNGASSQGQENSGGKRP